MSTEDIDRGYKKILSELKAIEQEPFVKIGILKDEKHDSKSGDGASLLTIASVHEFGAPSKKIPERSYLRSTADKNSKRIQNHITRGYDDIIKGKDSVLNVLTKIGILVQSLVQQKITSLREPALKESTVKRKGSSNPLIDTGQLRQSIRYEVVKKGKGRK